MLLRFTDDALKGNAKSATFLLNRYRVTEGIAPETDELDQDDREIINAFLNRLGSDLKGKKGGS